VARGAACPPQLDRLAEVRGRPWAYSWRRRRANALLAEDAAFCAALRASSPSLLLPSRLLVELSQADVDALRRAATPSGASAPVATQVALTAHALLVLLSFAPTAPQGRVRVGVLTDARRFLERADAFGNWYFCVYVCWTMSRTSKAADTPTQQLVDAASAIARGMSAVDHKFAVRALSQQAALHAPSPILRTVDRACTGNIQQVFACRDAKRALATRTLGSGISIGHKWMGPLQLRDADVDFDIEMNTAAVELPCFGPRRGDADTPVAMQVSACLTSRPEFLRQIMCLPASDGGVVLCIPNALFGYQVQRSSEVRAALRNVQTYNDSAADRE
jgi:hypothetical protein